ncbi:uncharacterized protein LOC125041079 [Penaeus chinensis]|uniref:uncharacterized protein LOC125041079 n=1 Tax=Penaeus chinensis TaxID=139456 RepID=UPI001FB8343E|nr:uncharacterized protein LOC125041079 [Penaeus chinensis]
MEKKKIECCVYKKLDEEDRRPRSWEMGISCTKLCRIAEQKRLWKLPGHQTYLTPNKDVGKKIIDKRLRNRVEESAHKLGFVPNRITEYAVFALRQVVEKYREGQEKMHCIYLDLEKAHDRVLRQEVWNCLRLKKVEEKYVRLVQDICEGSKTLVRCAAGDTEEFEDTVGLHHGSALSPFLIAVIIKCMTEKVQREARCGE